MDALTRFMTKQYCAENILFLQRVHYLNEMVEGIAMMAMSPFLNRPEDHEPHSPILHKVHCSMFEIYSVFIADSAPQQINLKYAVRSRIQCIFSADTDALSEYTLYQKRHLFDECIAEIEHLVNVSVLPGFYRSPEFLDLLQEWERTAESASFGKLVKMPSVPTQSAMNTKISAPLDHGIWRRKQSFSVVTDNDSGSKHSEFVHSPSLCSSERPKSFSSVISLPQSDSALSEDISSEEFETDPVSGCSFHSDKLLISRFIDQPFESGKGRRIHFGGIVEQQNGQNVLFDRNAIGCEVAECTEWEIQIVAMDPDCSMELGVVATEYIDSLSSPRCDGVRFTRCFENKPHGARAVIGHKPRANDSAAPSMLYGSWNQDGKTRCFRDLSPKLQCYAVGDILRVKLDLKRNKIRFFLNDEKVRSAMSVQCGNTYHPFIAFTGNFKYKLL